MYAISTGMYILRGKGEEGGASSLKLNMTDPYRTVPYHAIASTLVEGCQASGLGHLLQYMCEYNAERPKQDRKRFNSIVKTMGFDHIVIIYLWMYGTGTLLFLLLFIPNTSRYFKSYFGILNRFLCNISLLNMLFRYKRKRR